MTEKEKGYQGESIAINYLKDNGYIILKKNYHTPCGEIDVICQKEDCLVFVEVKLRNNELFGLADEQLSQRQKERILNSAQHYLDQQEEFTKECRFDYITLVSEAGLYRIHHVINAFEKDY